jgi:hypothetical protein
MWCRFMFITFHKYNHKNDIFFPLLRLPVNLNHIPQFSYNLTFNISRSAYLNLLHWYEDLFSYVKFHNVLHWNSVFHINSEESSHFT